jgi:hypothetical protein
MLAAAQQLHRQQQQLAGIAAAVAAGGGHGGSSGPLQAPLLAQLGEVSGRVSRLEEFMEAQVELIPDWQKALEVVQALKRCAGGELWWAAAQLFIWDLLWILGRGWA